MSTNETQTTAGTSNTDPGSSSAGTANAGETSAIKEAFNAQKVPEDKTQQTTAETQTKETKDEAKDSKTGDKPVEGKTEQDKKDADSAKKEDAKKAPESYADFKLPDGVKINEGIMVEVKGLAKDLGLPQAEAQKVVDLGAKFAAKWGEQYQENIKATQKQWAADLSKDAKIGGEKLKENLAVAQKGLNSYDTDGKLNALLQETGLNNNVEVVRFFHKLGSSISEDKVVAPNAGGSIMSQGGPGSLVAAASALYGKK